MASPHYTLTRSHGVRGCGVNSFPYRAEQPSALLTDLYQLTMLDAYYRLGMEQTAIFEFFVRRLPERRSFLIAAGLEQVLDYLETLKFSSEELDRKSVV